MLLPITLVQLSLRDFQWQTLQLLHPLVGGQDPEEATLALGKLTLRPGGPRRPLDQRLEGGQVAEETTLASG